MRELKKSSWIITLYLLTSHLLRNYVMKGREGALKSFFIDFFQEVSRSMESEDQELIKFKLAISHGTTSKESISFRHKVILTRFLTYAKNLLPLDPKRDYTEEEKMAIFRMYNGRCQRYGEKLEMDNYHVHYKIPWSEGGEQP